MDRKTIKQAGADTFHGKRVLVRVDFNVPQHEDGTIADDTRIKAALPTIEFLRKAGAKIILMSHLGRPKGGPSEKFSLKHVTSRLAELLGAHVEHVDACVGDKVKHAVDKMKDSQVIMLENVRFHPEEEKNDPEFAKKLASNADIYVSDAFGSAHRAHASTEGVTKHVSTSLAGLLMDKELKALSGVLHAPGKPFACIIGGSKVSTKLGVLQHLMSKVDVLVIGGAMAFSFLKAQGKEVGKSLVEDDKLDVCRKFMQEAKDKGVQLILPVDVVCAPEFKAGSPATVVAADAMPADQMGLDLGPKTMASIKDALSKCKTILWNGPLGAFETQGFEKATYELIDLLVTLTQKGAKTVVGGGDSVAAIEAKGVDTNCFTHVSTGGGASLEYLEGIELPGVACLEPTQPAKTSA